MDYPSFRVRMEIVGNFLTYGISKLESPLLNEVCTSVKSTSPDTENHNKNGYVKLYDDKNLIMTNVDNCDTTYTNKHKNTKYNVRDRYD